VIFRVCTTSGSGSWVHRSGCDLSPLDVALAVFPEVACSVPGGTEQPGFRRNRTTPLVIFTSPSESDPTARPSSGARPRRNRRPAQAPLMRFLSPSAHEVGSVHSPWKPTPKRPRSATEATHRPHRSARCLEPRVLPSRFVPSSPFHTTSTVCSALDRPESPRVTLMGFGSFRVSPDPGGPARYRTCRPLLPFRGGRFAAGLASDRRARPPSTSGCLSEDRPSPPASGFPSVGARSPHGLVCETSHHLPFRARVPSEERALPWEVRRRFPYAERRPFGLVTISV